MERNNNPTTYNYNSKGAYRVGTFFCPLYKLQGQSSRSKLEGFHPPCGSHLLARHANPAPANPPCPCGGGGVSEFCPAKSSLPMRQACGCVKKRRVGRAAGRQAHCRWAMAGSASEVYSRCAPSCLVARVRRRRLQSGRARVVGGRGGRTHFVGTGGGKPRRGGHRAGAVPSA